MFISLETQALVKEISELLLKTHSTLAVSESACGGLISASMVSIPGASQWFVGGTTTYALKSRLKLSGWSQEDIKAYTGPSEDVVKRLARNLRVELNATYVLAETGWAGPDLNNPEVGDVYIGVYGPSGNKAVKRKSDANERTSNMESFTHLAITHLLEVLKEDMKDN